MSHDVQYWLLLNWRLTKKRRLLFFFLKKAFLLLIPVFPNTLLGQEFHLDNVSNFFSKNNKFCTESLN